MTAAQKSRGQNFKNVHWRKDEQYLDQLKCQGLFVRSHPNLTYQNLFYLVDFILRVQNSRTHKKCLERGGSFKLYLESDLLSFTFKVDQSDLLRMLGTAWGLLFVPGATFDTGHNPLVTEETLQCWTKLLQTSEEQSETLFSPRKEKFSPIPHLRWKSHPLLLKQQLLQHPH